MRFGAAACAAAALWAASAAAEPATIAIGYLHTTPSRQKLSLIDVPAADDGLAGARVGLDDDNTTGAFLDQRFMLIDQQIEPDEDPRPAVRALADQGAGFIVAALEADPLLAAADEARAKGVTILNVAATDERLREADCRGNLVHVAPSRAMLADGLAQYFAARRWTKWALVVGSHPADKLWADALRRAAARFGAKIVGERDYVDTGGARRTDSGLADVQRQMPVATRGFPDHDVLVAADESEVFAGYLPFRTWDPRPVAGSAGLAPSSWNPAFDQWGALQLQNRFARSARRTMTALDMQAWTAVRMVGEAAARTASNDAARLAAYMKSPDFSIAAFKGQKLTLRDWNLQLRQPVLLFDGRNTVSVSPQEGFLHPQSALDTLGLDRPETKCALK